MRTRIKPDPEAWLRIIDQMLEDRRYQSSSAFLHDVRHTITEKDQVTPGQTKEILKIRRADRF